MKDVSAGSTIHVPLSRGVSTLELMIAMAIIAVALVGALNANYGAQYWSITSQTSNEGLYKAKTALEDQRALIKQDFYQAVSTPFARSVDASDPNDAACIAGGLCYYVQTTVTDISSCSKFVQADVAWKVDGYSTTTTTLFTNLTNSGEATALGGDCILNQPSGRWDTQAPQNVGSLSFVPGHLFTGIDVLHKEVYAAASTSPYFSVYDVPTAVGQNPVIAGFTDGSGKRLNDVDTMEDLATGRTYAYASEHATTTGLAVFDATDPTTPTLVTERQLQGIDLYGSYPQGWRVYAYGNRLYLTTRETAGNEFHIFNINDPTQPVEVANFKLGRTVNDIIVRDQKVSGVVHRLVFLASQSDTKQLGVLDVTNDVITEVASLPGVPDGDSLALLGHTLYVGTEPNAGGPELSMYDVTNPSASIPLIGSAEVGTAVTTLRVTGGYAFAGTATQIQVWSADLQTHYQNYGFTHLAPTASYTTPFGKGFDIDGNWLYMIGQWKAGDSLQVIYAP